MGCHDSEDNLPSGSAWATSPPSRRAVARRELDSDRTLARYKGCSQEGRAQEPVKVKRTLPRMQDKVRAVMHTT